MNNQMKHTGCRSHMWWKSTGLSLVSRFVQKSSSADRNMVNIFSDTFVTCKITSKKHFTTVVHKSKHSFSRVTINRSRMLWRNRNLLYLIVGNFLLHGFGSGFQRRNLFAVVLSVQYLHLLRQNAVNIYHLLFCKNLLFASIVKTEHTTYHQQTTASNIFHHWDTGHCKKVKSREQSQEKFHNPHETFHTLHLCSSKMFSLTFGGHFNERFEHFQQPVCVNASDVFSELKIKLPFSRQHARRRKMAWKQNTCCGSFGASPFSFCTKRWRHWLPSLTAPCDWLIVTSRRIPSGQAEVGSSPKTQTEGIFISSYI